MNIDVLRKNAQQTCIERGVRFTPARELAFTLLAKQKSSIGAYDLLELMKQEDKGAKPATVYRALDFLCEQGFVHKIESINAFILCDHFCDSAHPVQLLICDQCGHVEEIRSDNLDLAIRAMADASGFRISHQIVEAHGKCSDC